MEILAGGTLALLTKLGNPVTVVTMTAGDCGSAEEPPERISAIRREEARLGAQLLGAEYRCAEFQDLVVFNDDPSRRRVVEIIRSVAPEIVCTAAPSDYHCDHEATSELVRDACFAVSAPNYRTGAADPAPPMPRIPHLYYVDSIEGVDRDGRSVEPHFHVDVSTVFDTKRQALAAHASQRAWLRRQHGMDEYLLTMEQWSRRRGEEVGVSYAEGFRQYRGHPYPTTPWLQELLKDYLVGERKAGK